MPGNLLATFEKGLVKSFGAGSIPAPIFSTP